MVRASFLPSPLPVITPTTRRLVPREQSTMPSKGPPMNDPINQPHEYPGFANDADLASRPADAEMNESLAMKRVEVFAMFAHGRLVAADAESAKELAAIIERAEAREARIAFNALFQLDAAFAAAKRG